MQRFLDGLRHNLGEETYEQERERGAKMPVLEVVREVEALA